MIHILTLTVFRKEYYDTCERYVDFRKLTTEMIQYIFKDACSLLEMQICRLCDCLFICCCLFVFENPWIERLVACSQCSEFWFM